MEVTLTNGESCMRQCDRIPAATDLRSKFFDAVGDDSRFEGVPALLERMERFDDLRRIIELFPIADDSYRGGP